MDPTTQIDPRVQALRDLLDTVWLVMERQVVQRQLFAFLAVFLAAWLLSFVVDRFLRWLAQERYGSGRRAGRWRIYGYRTLRALQYTLWPILGLVLSELMIGWFARNRWPTGLIEQLRPIFWLILIYRILLGLMQILFMERRARMYNRRFVAPLFVLITALVLGNTLQGTFGLAELNLFTVLDTPITLQGMINAFLILYFFFVFAWIARDLINRTATNRVDTDSGAISTITLVGYYTIVGIGVLTALSTLGFNLSTLAIVFGGLSVGIGFGLQEVVSNFVSGILLLFERTLRIGDIISVNNKTGTVDKLGMRATVLRTLDNIEILVPDQDLLTSTVETYTFSNRTVRRMVTVGVSYDSEPQQVRTLLLAIAERHGQILDNPAPEVFFAGFGDSSLDFELAVWLDSPPSVARVLSDLRFMIWSDFAKHNIEIPFPQRDVHFYPTDATLQDSHQGPDPGSAQNSAQ